MKYIDDLLNSLTMYQTVLYGLIIMATVAIVFNPIFLVSLILIILACKITNQIFAKVFHAMPNVESELITGLILFFIIDPRNYLAMILAAIISMSSKYLLAVNKKHIFNPAGIVVFIFWLFKYGYTIWWIATPILLPVTLIIGLLIVHKVQRFAMFISFLLAAVGVASLTKVSPIELVTSWPVIFFGTIMLTEPQTTPVTHKLQIVYGLLMGVLFSWQFTWAFVIGNIFSYLVSPKDRLILTLKSRNKLANNIYEFVYSCDRKLKFLAGQYLEWTLPHTKSDQRGVRRYFTIASSPTESDLHIAVRTSDTSSTFKTALLTESKIAASQLAGEFTLPEDVTRKIVWIAGGIGITPFRSQAKFLADTNQNRDVILLYMCANPSDFIYKDFFKNIQANYLVGRFDAKIISEKVPDYKTRLFYISGPHAMTMAYEDILKQLGVSSSNIYVDFFPGY